MSDIVYRLRSVSKSFKTKYAEVRALDDISFDIFEGEIIGVIGMSGAGKSTLVRTLNRLERVDSGKIEFYGQDLNSLSAKELSKARRQIGMIFQGFNLIGQRNVLNNVAVGMKIAGIPKAERLAKSREMLKVVGLEEKEKSFPAQLSGGQKQRVAIARALTMSPKVLLCDEATSALDPDITAEILSLLKRINKELGITIIVITHEMSVVEKICDRVVVVESGHVEEIGEVQKLFTDPESEVTRRLVFHDMKQDNPFDMTDKECIRIVFDGRRATEPMIADIVTRTGAMLNILSANTRSVNGVGYGQMIVELPDDENQKTAVMDYFRENNITVSTVSREELS